uniref:Uncharacterized protein n=1 Tax=Anguilla anguilla TaxID=7936 RepID=A0A0E9RPM1_ANGAN
MVIHYHGMGLSVWLFTDHQQGAMWVGLRAP